jgi:hypothetical protein
MSQRHRFWPHIGLMHEKPMGYLTFLLTFPEKWIEQKKKNDEAAR